MTYNIQNFAPSQPSGFGGAEAFLAGRDRRDAQVLYQDQIAAAKAKQDAIDREKAIAIYEAQAAAQAKAQAEAEDKAYMSGLFMKAHENPTWENRSLLINEQARRNPAVAKEIRENFLQQDEATQKTVLRDSSNILTAFDTNPEIGISLLEELATAAENAGDAGDAKGYRDMAARAKAGPQGIMAVKDFYTRVIGAIDPEALKAVSEAWKVKKERDAEPTVQRQRLLDAGKTEAETNKILAETRKLDAEAKKALIDLEVKKAGGLYSPEDAAAAEDALRKELNGRQSYFKEVRNAYDVISSSDTTSIGDIALISTYMKLLDPNSAVREAEFATAANAGGVPDAVRNMYNKVMTGGKITPEIRADIMSQSKKVFEKAQSQAKGEEAFFTKIAKDRGLNVDRIIYAEPVSTQSTTGASPTANVVGAPAGVGKAVPGGGIDEAGLRAYIEANSPAADRAEARSIKDFNELQRVFSKSARAYAATLAPKKPTEEADF